MLIIYLLALIFSIGTAPALAEGEYKKGCDFYAAGKYSQALPLFKQSARANPRYWPGHYYLAHTYLALGQKSAARGEYQSCLDLQPGASVSLSCRKVLNSLGGSDFATVGGGMTLLPVDPLAAQGGDKNPAAGVARQNAQLAENKKWATRSTAMSQSELIPSVMDEK
jgi:tetratricopeptide (TPR) repeat protein